ncbi:DUF2237 family protein [Winogradskyella aurantia]|uniref:DUF2237 domain-containing protein n=1 Tax=Winogradskyella aurantia TaxID=1915063 RepID=A0A265UWN9_9FLAO|nr:DUF2237 domain-containing protein [Winogradskyella aurantia]OZV69724.1 hypothetical protein CA834_03625 [Winogradskyella aurantia]
MLRNVLGTALEPCCLDPMTGYFRDGLCRTMAQDTGTHVVCAVMTDAFLNFTRLKGNDLSTPRPEWQFPGLKAGDKWCLCISRWLEAEASGCAPRLILEATHEKALEFTELALLQSYAVQ